MMHSVYVGLGANLGDRAATLAAAVAALRETGRLRRASSLYQTRPWGKTDQPGFLNAVVELQTTLGPRAFLDALHAIERQLGRAGSERWGPRTIDLDLLLYDDLQLDEPGLRVPHERLYERAFVLVPLAELEPRFAAARDALEATERAGVALAAQGERARFASALRESDGEMAAHPASVVARVRALADFLAERGVARARIERGGESIEVARRSGGRGASRVEARAAEAPPVRVDTIKADIVGIFHLSRPAPAEGDLFESDRELGYIEALGIRTPVHSLGAGRLVAIAAADDRPVEYGQALFSIARG